MADIRIYDVKWAVQTAGPSPDFFRTELFFKGCKRAEYGMPCEGCFNEVIWDSSTNISYSATRAAKHFAEHAPNRFITIGGGEPTDQIDGLIELCRELKAWGFHVMVYTWRSINDLIVQGVLPYIDILVDGEYKAEERVYQEENEDGFLNSIGSGNQIVWDVKKYNENSRAEAVIGFAVRELMGLQLDLGNCDLKYITKDYCDPELYRITKGVAA